MGDRAGRGEINPTLEFYELAEMSVGEAAKLFGDLQAERAQVISVTYRPTGDLIVVTPFDQDTTRRLLAQVGAELDQPGSVH